MPWSAATVICLCLFVGAMGKSAQVPLHVWLPDSMEGPTPISALIHAATMVTAGIFMVARMSPLFELSETALSTVLVIGATTAFFTGLIGIVQNDIKRVVAYSTLSQLGYMTVALGVSAYSAAIFHLMTHAFFKALLFLGAGSVIIAMHHEQDMRYMGGLRRYMPITCDHELDRHARADRHAGIRRILLQGRDHRGRAGIASLGIGLRVLVRAARRVRHGVVQLPPAVPDVPRHANASSSSTAMHDGHDDHAHHEPGHLAHAPHESPWVVTVPLILLAIPSVVIGAIDGGSMLHGDFFGAAIVVALNTSGRRRFRRLACRRCSTASPHAPFWLAFARFRGRDLHLSVQSVDRRQDQERAASAVEHARPQILVRRGLPGGVRARLAAARPRLVEGRRCRRDRQRPDRRHRRRRSAASRAIVRWVQTGYLYTYAFAMILGLVVLLGGLWWVVRNASATSQCLHWTSIAIHCD